MWLEHERIGELPRNVGEGRLVRNVSTHIRCNAVGKRMDIWGKFDLEERREMER